MEYHLDITLISGIIMYCNKSVAVVSILSGFDHFLFGSNTKAYANWKMSHLFQLNPFTDDFIISIFFVLSNQLCPVPHFSLSEFVLV